MIFMEIHNFKFSPIWQFIDSWSHGTIVSGDEYLRKLDIWFVLPWGLGVISELKIQIHSKSVDYIFILCQRMKNNFGKFRF